MTFRGDTERQKPGKSLNLSMPREPLQPGGIFREATLPAVLELQMMVPTHPPRQRKA